MTQPEPHPRPTAELWAMARADFTSGVSAAVVAERYGISLRSVRRRAALEGWRRGDFMPGTLGPPPPWMRSPETRTEAVADDPALEEVDEAESTARFALLFNPEPRALRRFAFRRAAESAAVDRPQEATAWMRLVQLAHRCGDRVERDGQPFRDIDYIRAAYLRRAGEAFPEDEEVEEGAAGTPPPEPESP
ncbi:MAG: hypothetical protein Q8S03_04635 [Brevundimonas sp.]|uniref:hypothetical protein n=1 Tax=Brevundimonas sp. TaxID=1871086 RepID=UPI0027351E0F|nr:hypothetical protein [Brevundimonas sp.]MDP3403955.1 hypothetical protein [Brevundimonas sp.]